MRIAIIGSGVSGLTAAHGLHRRHDITLFEAAPYVGGHVNTIDVDLGDERHAIDTGFIVFNETNYPHFCQLLKDLDVACKPTSMSFSVRCDQTGLEYNGTSLNRLFSQRTNFLRPRFYKMVRDILRFNREGAALLTEQGDDMSVSDYLTANNYSEAFAEKYLVPLGSSLWSCPAGTFRNFPIRFVVEFLSQHAMMQVDGRPTWRVVEGGSQRYVQKLIVPFQDRIRLNTPVKSVQRHADRVRILEAYGAAGDFDHVVFALPMWLACRNAAPLGWLDAAGVAMWIIALAGEGVADQQLAAFKLKPANRGKVCRDGLWRYSRHPNYFFEWLHWWAYVLLGWQGPSGWLTLSGPIVMYLFLTKLTGIPPTEERALESRGEAYKQYQRTTSSFFPWPPRSEAL